MKEVFCDSSYFIALAHRDDQHHSSALVLTEQLDSVTMVTTHEVLVETLNFFSERGVFLRDAIIEIVDGFCAQTTTCLCPPSEELFFAGYDLYRSRRDKGYSLTDCISMTVMLQRNITRVLSTDRHFKQEGFFILM